MTSGAINLAPVVRREDAECPRVDLARRTADSVGVVFDDEEHGQLFLFRETNGLEKIALARGGVANGGDDNVGFAIELNAPGDAAGGKKLRAGGRGHAPDVTFGVTEMRRHLAAVALAVALRHVIERELARFDAAPEHERAVPIIRADVIAFVHLQRDGGERFVAHPRDVKMTFALSI